MPTQVSFGSYIPGESAIHNANAQVKIVLTCAFSIGIFFVDTWIGMAVVAACLALVYGLAKISLMRGLRGLGPIAFILAFTVLVHALDFTFEGLLDGLFIAARIALLVLACGLLTFTTSALSLTEALGWLLTPLGRLGAPVGDLSMVASLALRFIPLTASEAYALRKAQMARCGDFESGSPLARAKAWIPVLVSLVVRLFLRAEELARGMEARGYSGRKASRMGAERPDGASLLLFGILLAVLIAICVML